MTCQNKFLKLHLFKVSCKSKLLVERPPAADDITLIMLYSITLVFLYLFYSIRARIIKIVKRERTRRCDQHQFFWKAGVISLSTTLRLLNILNLSLFLLIFLLTYCTWWWYNHQFWCILNPSAILHLVIFT